MRRGSSLPGAGALLLAAWAGCAQPDDRAHGPFLDEPFANAAAADDELAEGQHYFLYHVEGGPERVPGDEEPRGAIATSVAHRVLIDGDEEGGGGPDLGYVDLVLFLLGRGLDIKPSDGYRAPDLGGLWATPPYLHNGSVPTLEDLLRPAGERPKTFERGGFIVDTGVWGNGNEGHEFGTALDEEDRAALLAFLLSL